MADWEEVKRLAADFQRAQLSATVLKLSERNCIEIVQQLQIIGLIDVIYTTDGKEYLTPQELVKEIKEELFVRGGRINLVDLQQALNVDLTHIEAKVSELLKQDKHLSLVIGQLIDESYLDSICEEINDELQENGQVTLAVLTKQYNLPGDYLSEATSQRLGTIIEGQVDDLDKNIIFTQSFVSRYRARIRGAFSAVIKPTTVSSVIGQFGLQERLFHTILEELIKDGRISGSLSGPQYVPDIYTRSQNEWIDSFYKQNGYLEYDAVSRLGISDAKGFIKKRLKSEQLVYLSSCCVGKLIQEQVEYEIEDALSNDAWVDLTPCVPSVCSRKDINQLVQTAVKSKKNAVVFCETIVTSQDFVTNCSIPFDDVISKKAEEAVRTNPGLLLPDGDKKAKLLGAEDGREDKKEQRRKKATGGKSGGGTQGREVKTKSTKKKARGRDRDEDSDDDAPSAGARGRGADMMDFMPVSDIIEELNKLKALAECPEDLVEEIAYKLHRPLARQLQEAVKSVFLQTAGSSSGSGRKKTHGELSDKITGLWTNAKLFEKGVKFFSEETQGHLVKHLLKTMCTDICNLIFNAIATDAMMSVQDDTQITPEFRLKVLSKLPDDKVKTILTKLHTSLSGKSLEEFFRQVDAMCGSGQLEVVLRKPDKKKERQLLFNHRRSLADQLKSETDPAMTLHLASVLMFQVHAGAVVHAPGRCVPHVVAYLREHIPAEQHATLLEYQELVVTQLKLQNEASDDPSEADDVQQQLVSKAGTIKDLAFNTKKGNAAEAEET